MKNFPANIFIATESLIWRRVSGNWILNEPPLYVISSAQFKNWSLTTFFFSLFSESRIIRLLGFYIIKFINITESIDNNNCVQGYFCLNPIAWKLNAIGWHRLSKAASTHFLQRWNLCCYCCYAERAPLWNRQKLQCKVNFLFVTDQISSFLSAITTSPTTSRQTTTSSERIFLCLKLRFSKTIWLVEMDIF